MLLFSCILLSFGGCMSRSEKVLEGKEGLFAVIETQKGEIVLELFYKEAPLTVTNFVGLAEGTLTAAKGKPFYNGLKFHRVISKANRDSQDFMIQGGDPRGDGTGGPGYEFLNEYDTIFGKVVDEESQKVVNSIVVNNKMDKITIVRKGAEAEAFTATQADWDRENKAAQEKRIAEIKESFPGVSEDPSTGIFYIITKEGKGEKCGTGKTAYTHYRGYLVEKPTTGNQFDSSEGRAPLDFVTGENKMIKGFDLMVQDMKVGEKRTIILPPEYGYGSQGYPGVIPANSYIAFDIELVEIK